MKSTKCNFWVDFPVKFFLYKYFFWYYSNQNLNLCRVIAPFSRSHLVPTLHELVFSDIKPQLFDKQKITASLFHISRLKKRKTKAKKFYTLLDTRNCSTTIFSLFSSSLPLLFLVLGKMAFTILLSQYNSIVKLDVFLLNSMTANM